jgi:hypothetical protein
MNTKYKNIVIDLFTLNFKKETGFLSVELGKFNEKELKKVVDNKQKDLKKKEQVDVPEKSPKTKKTDNTPESDPKKKNLTVIKNDIDKLLSKLEESKVSNLKDFFKSDIINYNVINTKVLEYQELYNKNKLELEKNGDKLYTNFCGKKNGLANINQNKDVISKDLFIKKMLGEDENSPLDKKLIVEILHLYLQIQQFLTKSTTKKSNNVEKIIKLDEDSSERKVLEAIMEKEFDYKNITFKKQIKYINKYKEVIFNYITKNATLLIESFKELPLELASSSSASDINEETKKPKNTPKNLSINKLFAMSSLKDTYLSNLLHKYADKYDFIEKGQVSSTYNSNVKGILEKDKLISYLSQKNNFNFVINKLIDTNFKDININLDNKVKNFLAYLLVCVIYDDFLPILVMTNSQLITYKKKIVNPETKESKVIEDTKLTKVNINKIHPLIIQNILCRNLV